MRHTAFGLVAIGLAAAIFVGGCDQEPPVVTDGTRYGTVLPPGSVAGLPPSYAGYILKPGDTMFNVAEMLYGKDSRYFLIYQANRKWIDTDPKFWVPGRVILVPPNIDGTAIGVKTPEKYR